MLKELIVTTILVLCTATAVQAQVCAEMISQMTFPLKVDSITHIEGGRCEQGVMFWKYVVASPHGPFLKQSFPKFKSNVHSLLCEKPVVTHIKVNFKYDTVYEYYSDTDEFLFDVDCRQPLQGPLSSTKS